MRECSDERLELERLGPRRTGLETIGQLGAGAVGLEPREAGHAFELAELGLPMNLALRAVVAVDQRVRERAVLEMDLGRQAALHRQDLGAAQARYPARELRDIRKHAPARIRLAGHERRDGFHERSLPRYTRDACGSSAPIGATKSCWRPDGGPLHRSRT